MKNYIVSMIKGYFEALDVKYVCNEEETIIGAGLLDCKLLFEIKRNSLEHCLVFNEEMQKARWDEVQKYINCVNRILEEGQFKMDESGVVQFCISIEMPKSRKLAEQRMFYMMGKTDQALEDFYGKLVMVSEGKLTAEEAMRTFTMCATYVAPGYSVSRVDKTKN